MPDQRPLSREHWPSPSEDLLIEAAIGDDRAVTRAWSAWSDLNDLDDIGPGSFMVLPAVYANLRRLGFDGPNMDRIRGVYKQTWVRNNLLLAAALDSQRLLAKAGIEQVVFKGLALVAAGSADLGSRLMFDVDSVVREEDFAPALDQLRDHGWVDQHRAEAFPSSLHGHVTAVSLVSPRGQDIDVHRRTMGVSESAGEHDELFDRARATELRGSSFRILDPIDLLLSTCYHARKGDPQARARWVVDLHGLLGTVPDLDWEPVHERAVRRGALAPVRDVLTVAETRYSLGVPQPVLEEMWGVDLPNREVSEYRAACRRSSTGLTWAAYQLWKGHRAAHKGGREGAPRGYAAALTQYYQWRLRAARRRDIPPAAFRELRRKRSKV